MGLYCQYRGVKPWFHNNVTDYDPNDLELLIRPVKFQLESSVLSSTKNPSIAFPALYQLNVLKSSQVGKLSDILCNPCHV
jgi:hypothetical protein